ncbi:MAG: hypothetical protein ACRED5_16175 [Propylenella sp.]
MLTVLKELAENPARRAAFQRDPEAFVQRCETLSEYEKYLLLERDAAAIEGYLRNPVADPDNVSFAAPTVVNVAAVVIVVMRVPHEEPAVAAQAHFDTFWSRVEDRAHALA